LRLAHACLHALPLISLLIPCLGCCLALHSFPTRRSSDLAAFRKQLANLLLRQIHISGIPLRESFSSEIVEFWYHHPGAFYDCLRSEEHTSELQSREKLVCRLLLEKKKSI